MHELMNDWRSEWLNKATHWLSYLEHGILCSDLLACGSSLAINAKNKTTTNASDTKPTQVELESGSSFKFSNRITDD